MYNRKRPTDIYTKLVVTKGKRQGERSIQGMSLRDTNYYLSINKNKDILYSKGNYNH